MDEDRQRVETDTTDSLQVPERDETRVAIPGQAWQTIVIEPR